MRANRLQAESGARGKPREGDSAKAGRVGAAEGRGKSLGYAGPLTAISLGAVPGSRAEPREMAGHTQADSASPRSIPREGQEPGSSG